MKARVLHIASDRLVADLKRLRPRAASKRRTILAALLLLGMAALLISIVLPTRTPQLPAFFAAPVQRWAGELDAWSRTQSLDRDLLATVMQIESCGHPAAVSGSGAIGLFQVMPYHFAADEDMFDPQINARRGAAYLKQCLDQAEGVIGQALACYNGGPGVLGRARADWSAETRAYFRWGVGIYADAIAGNQGSDTLERWLAAGGQRLCDSAARALGA